LTSKQTQNIEFHQILGELFFAIASADNCVRNEEFNALNNAILEEWSVLEYAYSKNEITSILKAFKDLQDKPHHNAEYYFNRFIVFKKAHAVFFNKKINALILKTASKIANSFSNKNKSELILLAKLHIELNKTNS
jgi:hypothetical protein